SLPGGLSAKQVAGLEQVIKQYLLENPGVLVTSLSSYQSKQRVAKAQRQQQAVLENRAALADDPDAPVLGNPEGDVVVVEFFDYNCPYCRRVASLLRTTVAEDGNVRLVMKEFPILGPQSVIAARAALAAARQDKYEEFHFALMEGPGDLSETRLNRVALDLGMDLDLMRIDMNLPEINTMLRRNRELGTTLSIDGTPAFVIGDTLIPGAIDKATLKRLIAQARAKSS
ncbi:MAG: DsbA family protein, partial [Kiloniellaceae bacterium]